jgi:hypothetical protein
MIAEDECSEERRGSQLEVQPERNRGGHCKAESKQEQNGSTDTTGDNGAKEPELIAPIASRRQSDATASPGGRRHPDRRAQIEQPSELKRRQPGQQHLSGGRCCPEESGSEDGESNRTDQAGLFLCS